MNARLKLLVALAAAARVKTAFRWCKYTCSGSFCQRPATHQTSAALTVAEAWTTFPLPCSILTACSERLLCYATSCKHSWGLLQALAIPAFNFINAASKRAAPSFYVFSTSTDVISDTFSGRSDQRLKKNVECSGCRREGRYLKTNSLPWYGVSGAPPQRRNQIPGAALAPFSKPSGFASPRDNFQLKEVLSLSRLRTPPGERESSG